MPLYEYTCKSCSKRFEQLLFGREKPACPSCRGTNLERMLSTFAVGGGGSSGSASFGGGAGDDAGGDGGFGGACGTCGDPRGPGSCASD